MENLKDLPAGANFDKMKQMLDPKNIGQTMRMFMCLGQEESVAQFIEMADLSVEGPELVACAIKLGQIKTLELLLKKGVKSDITPYAVSPLVSDADWSKDYRKSPFMLQAAMAGNQDIYQMLMQHGRPLWETGFICLSRKKHNAVTGNVIACAAYHGQARILKYVLTKVSTSLKDEVNMAVTEEADIRPLTKSGYQAEFAGFTPLMLAVASEKANLDVVKQLLAAHATFTQKEKVTGDNIVHLAARHCPSLEILEYLVRSLNQDMLFERNKKGDTPLSICVALKNQPGVELLEKLQVTYDKSRQKTGDLLAQLDAEAEKAEREKQKRKDKKYRAKLQKVAERDHITVEEAEKRIQAKKEQEKLEEEKQKQQQKLKEEQEEKARLEELRRVEQAKEERLKMINRQQEEHRKEQALARAKREEERINAQRLEAQNATHKVVEASPGPQNRKQRKAVEQAERRERLRSVALSAKADDEEGSDAETPKAAEEPKKEDNTIVGLNGSMALSMLSKKAKKRMVQQMNQEEMEEKALRDRILKAKADEAEEQRRKQQELLQKEKAEKKALKEQLKAKAEEVQKQKDKAQAEKDAETAARRKAQQDRRAQNAQQTPRNVLDEVFMGGNATRQSARAKSQGVKEVQPANSLTETPKPAAAAPTPREKLQKVYKPKEAAKEAPAEPTPAADKDVKKADKKDKKQEKKQARQAAKDSAEPTAVNLGQVKAAPTPVAAPAVMTGNVVSKADYDALASQLKAKETAFEKQTHALQRELDAERKKAAQFQSALTQMQNEIEDMKADQLLSQTTQEAGGSSANEKELQVQLKMAQDQHKTQQQVNKALAAKVLMFEKQIADERKKRQDMERMLSTSSSQASVGANQGSDLGSVQKQLSDLKSRVKNLA